MNGGERRTIQDLAAAARTHLASGASGAVAGAFRGSLGQVGRAVAMLLVPMGLIVLALVVAPGARRTGSAVTAGSVRMVAGALIIAALLWGAAKVVRRLPMGRFLPGAEGPIRVVARTYVGAKESLCLVEVGGTTLLLSITATGVSTLHVWPDGVGDSIGSRRGGDRPDTARSLHDLARDRGQRGGPGARTVMSEPAREAMSVFPGQLEGLRALLTAGRRG